MGRLAKEVGMRGRRTVGLPIIGQCKRAVITKQVPVMGILWL